jgi:hypothetical protein
LFFKEYKEEVRMDRKEEARRAGSKCKLIMSRKEMQIDHEQEGNDN